jgi:uncharacterized membrane protein
MINKLNRFNNMMDRLMHTGTWCVITIAATGMCAWCLATADNGAGIALWTLMSLISLFNSALSVRNLLHGGKE